jgi:lipid II:glycine glycyltransferase (peptidoglycan interpeptide bridge formation enzyme)
MLDAYVAMQSYKQLGEQISRAELTSLLEVFDEDCIVVRCDNAGGRLIALRGALLFGNRAWDFFAAATPEGRKVYASHAAFWELMRQCANRGVCWYDMSGIDPINNKGVYDFKKGTGAREVAYLGEWDRATSRMLRTAANFLIGWRKRGM